MTASEEKLRHILLCLVGGTPQVVTETLYALTQERGEQVDEICVITTPFGKKRIFEMLLNSGQGKFFQFCQDFGFDPQSIKFDDTTILLLRAPNGQVLEDLITEEENRCAINHICEIVRGMTQDQFTRLHASIGGGRKTMSVGLTTAMQLFGRQQDRLSHVLIAPEYENHPQFFYPRPQPEALSDRNSAPITAKQWVSVADIDFIRLSGILSEWLGKEPVSYSQLVKRAQEELDVRVGKLCLHLAENRVSVANRSVELQPREFFIYCLLANASLKNTGQSFISLSQLSREHLAGVFSLVAPLRNPELFLPGEEASIDTVGQIKAYEFISTLLFGIKKRDDKHDFKTLEKTFGEVKSRVNAKFEEACLPERFQILKSGKKSISSYGLDIAPHELIFISPPVA